MKANELMIGDWFRYSYTIDGREKVKTFRISRIENELGKYYVWGNGYGRMCYPDRLEPIPLTPEILEKNGFKYDGSGRRSMMMMTPFGEQGIRWNIWVGLRDKTIEAFAAHPEERTPNWRKHNKVYLEVCGCYVHELQHALRLCGIDKDIVI